MKGTSLIREEISLICEESFGGAPNPWSWWSLSSKWTRKSNIAPIKIPPKKDAMIFKIVNNAKGKMKSKKKNDTSCKQVCV